MILDEKPLKLEGELERKTKRSKIAENLSTQWEWERKPGVEHSAEYGRWEDAWTKNLSTWKETWRGKPGT